METNLTQTDVVVVGGGIAGLSTACYLARAGVPVTLFEKVANLGGRATTENRMATFSIRVYAVVNPKKLHWLSK